MEDERLAEASRRYQQLSHESRALFLEYAVFEVSIAARAGYPSGGVSAEIALRYMQGLNEALHVLSRTRIAQRESPRSAGDDDVIIRAGTAFSMYARPHVDMPLSFINPIYAAFRHIVRVGESSVN